MKAAVAADEAAGETHFCNDRWEFPTFQVMRKNVISKFELREYFTFIAPNGIDKPFLLGL